MKTRKCVAQNPIGVLRVRHRKFFPAKKFSIAIEIPIKNIFDSRNPAKFFPSNVRIFFFTIHVRKNFPARFPLSANPPLFITFSPPDSPILRRKTPMPVCRVIAPLRPHEPPWERPKPLTGTRSASRARLFRHLFLRRKTCKNMRIRHRFSLVWGSGPEKEGNRSPVRARIGASPGGWCSPTGALPHRRSGCIAPGPGPCQNLKPDLSSDRPTECVGT